MSLLGYVIGLTTSGGISVLVLSFSELHMHMMEVSDQNFVYEELREKTSCVSGAKRLKMMPMLDASSNGQCSVAEKRWERMRCKELIDDFAVRRFCIDL
ncbi:hypothetical protein Gotur_027124, partial [Gossypium turneri]